MSGMTQNILRERQIVAQPLASLVARRLIDGLICFILTIALIQAPLAWAWPGLMPDQGLRQRRAAEDWVKGRAMTDLPHRPLEPRPGNPNAQLGEPGEREEPDVIRQLPDLEAIVLYRDLIDRGEMPEVNEARLRRRVDSLTAALRSAVEGPLSRWRELNNAFRAQLLKPGPMGPIEITFEDFLSFHAIPYIQALRNQPRIGIGYPGTAAGGKTTAAYVTHEKFERAFPNRRIRILHFDDFLLQREDRPDPTSQDPFMKFEVDRYREFVRRLRINERATKPIYDQTSRGRLKFGLDASGNIVILNGDRTITINLHENGTLSFQEMWRRGEELIDMTERRGAPHQQIRFAERFISGSTPIQLARREDGLLEVVIRDSLFHIRRQEANLVLEIEGEEPIVLSRDKRVEALEVWNPAQLDPRTGFEGELVIGEGILLLESDDWDLTANINASYFVRRNRALRREMGRGRDRREVELIAHAWYLRQFEEDSLVDALNARAEQVRGWGTARSNHFQINSLTLPELIARNRSYNQIEPKDHTFFRHYSIDLKEIVKEMEKGAHGNLIELMRGEVKRAREEGRPFTHPGPFPGETALPLSEAYERYWKGIEGPLARFVTPALGQFLLMKFELSPRRDFGDLSSKTETEIEHLLDRTEGLFVGAQILDLEPWPGRLTIPFKVIEPSEDPGGYSETIYEVGVKKALILNQLPYLEGRLNQIANTYEQLLQAGREEAQQRFEEGIHWIDAFFDLQRRLWLMGIVDRAPDLMRRYGIRFYRGREIVQAVAPGSLILDEEAIRDYARIAAAQDARPLSRKKAYMNLEGYRRLKGFQRQFVYNIDTGEDFLSRIPPVFRQHYVERILHQVPVNSEQLVHLSRFGSVWQEAIRQKMTWRYRDSGVSAAVVDGARIDAANDGIARNELERLTQYFEEHFREIPRPPGRPQLALAILYLHALPPDPNTALFTYIDFLLRRLIEDPLWIGRLKREGFSETEITSQIFEQIHIEMDRQYRERGEIPPSGRVWEELVFYEVISRIVHSPYTWDEFFAHQRVRPEAQGMKPPGDAARPTLDEGLTASEALSHAL